MFSLFFVHKTSGFLKFFFLFFFTYWRWFWCVVVFRCFENEKFFYTGESALFPKMRPRVAHTGPNVAPITPTTTWKKVISYYFYFYIYFWFLLFAQKETAIKMYIYKSRYDKPCHHHHQILTIARKLIFSSRFQLLLWEN